jgi:hypothetical protein
MSDKKKPTINLTEHISNIVFEKKEESNSLSEKLTLEQERLHKHQKLLKLQVQSVALPPNYSPAPKTEAQVMDWLRNTVKSRYSSAYALCLKYGEKLKIKLNQKEPYTN